MSKDELNKLINPSWMDEINKMQKQHEALNNFAHQSSAIANMQQQMEALRQSMTIQEPKWLAAANAIAEHSNRILNSLEEPAWMKNLKRFEDISFQTSLAIENSSLHSSLIKNAELLNNSFNEPKWTKIFDHNKQLLRAVEQSSWMKSFQRFDELSKQSIKAFEYSKSFSKLIDSAKATSQLCNLEAFEAIAKLHNSPLNHFGKLAETAFKKQEYRKDIHELDDDIYSDIAQENDFEKLPTNVQNKIIYYLKFIFLTIFLNLLSNYIYDQRELLAQTLRLIEKPSEVKKFARSGSSRFEREVLSGLRVVSGNDVNLRASPSMKSDIILQLDTGTLIEVVDKSNRVWLLVEISDGEDVIQGWIARRYTVYFK